MIDEREKRIIARMSDKDLSINVSWAINNATQMVARSSDSDEEKAKKVQRWATWYLRFYDKLREEEASKRVAKDDANERAL